MTTLELADLIVLEVLNAAYEQGYGDGHLRGGTEKIVGAVFKTLRENSSWFCRVVESETGPTIETPYEQVQQELFK